VKAPPKAAQGRRSDAKTQRRRELSGKFYIIAFSKNVDPMRRVILLFGLLSIFIITNAQKKKAVFVIVDGIPADVIEKINTPALDAIAKVGGYKRVYVGGEKGGYSQTPTISAVGYNSVMTGVWVNKHNVWDNDIAAPNYNYWNIFRFLKHSNPEKQIAIFSSWEDNRTKLVGEKLAAAGNIKFDHYYDGLELDTLKFPHDNKSDYMHRIDEDVVANAASYIRSKAPDLSWVYLEYTDDMGHTYGDSKEFYNAVELMDKQMSSLWQAIEHRRKNYKEDWLIVITTDHVRDSATGKNHGGQSNRERSGWIVTNAKSLNAPFKTGNPSIIDIMPTIASFMNIWIPRENKMEVDGTPLIGNISAIDAKAVRENNNIKVIWKPLTQNGNVKIWLATTNKFKTGDKDEYKMVGEFPLKNGKAEIDVSKMPSEFYKVVIETPTNMLNRWIVNKP